MHLNKEQLLANIDAVEYITAVIYQGLLNDEQVKERSPFITLTGTKADHVGDKVSDFCERYKGHNWTMMLKRADNSHGVGVNLVTVELLENSTALIPDKIIPAPTMNGTSTAEIEARVRKELGLEFEIKTLTAQVASLVKGAIPDTNANNTIDQLSILGAKIMKEFSKDDDESEAGFLGLLNTMSGGALSNEVAALNGTIVDDTELTQKEIDLVINFIGKAAIKKLAGKIERDELSVMEKTMLKGM